MRRPAARPRLPRPAAYLRSPIFEEVAPGLLERNAGAPADRLVDLLGAAAQHRDVRRPEACGVGPDLDAVERGLRHQKVQHALDRPVDAGAEVVDLARRPPLEQRPVALHDVAHVGEVPRGLEIAHAHERLTNPRLRLRDLLRDRRRGEGLAPTGARRRLAGSPDAGVTYVALAFEV